MVLDALIKIKNEQDPTLTFRRSCREGEIVHDEEWLQILHFLIFPQEYVDLVLWILTVEIPLHVYVRLEGIRSQSI